MSNCRWYEIDGFASLYEVANFEAYLDRQVADGHAEQVAAAYGITTDASTSVRCFRWKGTGDIWRLIPPHGSTRGCWQPV